MADPVTYDDILDHDHWHHRIPLDGDRVTPGLSGPDRWTVLDLPDDLDGRSFLDVGTFDGLLAFEAERRGASEVLGTDLWDSADAEYWSDLHPDRPGFFLVQEYLDSDVRGRRIDIADISPDEVGTFDVVVCAGLLTLLPDPVSAVQNLVDVTEERLVIQSGLTDGFSDPSGAEFAYSEEDAMTIWWMPNLEGLERMVSACGCKRTSAFHPSYPEPEPSYGCAVRDDDTPLFRTRHREEVLRTLDSGAGVVVTCEDDDLYRVQLDRESEQQGWVPVAAVDTSPTRTSVEQARHLLSRATEIRREHGIRALGTRGTRYLASTLLPERSSDITEIEGIVHGWPE